MLLFVCHELYVILLVHVCTCVMLVSLAITVLNQHFSGVVVCVVDEIMGCTNCCNIRSQRKFTWRKGKTDSDENSTQVAEKKPADAKVPPPRPPPPSGSVCKADLQAVATKKEESSFKASPDEEVETAKSKYSLQAEGRKSVYNSVLYYVLHLVMV